MTLRERLRELLPTRGGATVRRARFHHATYDFRSGYLRVGDGDREWYVGTLDEAVDEVLRREGLDGDEEVR